VRDNLFEGANLTPKEARQTLEGMCIAQREMNFFKPIAPEEMAIEKDNLAQHAIRRQDVERRKKEANDAFNAEIKELSKHFDETLEVIKTGGVNVEEEVFDIPDFETRQIVTRDENGSYIQARPMTPEERQRNLGHDLAYANAILMKPMPPKDDDFPAEETDEDNK